LRTPLSVTVSHSLAETADCSKLTDQLDIRKLHSITNLAEGGRLRPALPGPTFDAGASAKREVVALEIVKRSSKKKLQRGAAQRYPGVA
jgi:hypothetical protein